MLAYLHEHSLLDPVQLRSKTAHRVRQVLYQLPSELAINLISRTLVGSRCTKLLHWLRWSLNNAIRLLVFIRHSQVEYLPILLLK